MTTPLRAVSKSRRAPKRVRCTACDGALVAVAVVTHNRYGEEGAGIRLDHVECGVCASTGYTKRKLDKACCCSGPVSERCDGCKNARRGGAEVHVCGVPTEDEIAFETEMAMMATPRSGAKTTAAAHALGDGVGERSGQRGNR